MKDLYNFDVQRRQLVNSLRKKGIHDELVLEAMLAVPRHLFVHKDHIESSYRDHAYPIGSGQTISQPYTVAYQSQLLEVKKGDKILEIGTGSCYQTAVLCAMGAEVYSVERIKALFDMSDLFMTQLGFHSRLYFGDGNKGLPEHCPFDKIIITAATDKIPEALVKQLKTGGRIVLPLGGRSVQIMTVIEKKSEGSIYKEEHGLFVFVPLLKGTE